MAGLGTVTENRGTWLSVAGGFIWNRKADSSDPNFRTQKYTRADKTEGERSGAAYGTLTGMVTDVLFRTHDDYGDNINVTISASGEEYVLSVSLNNRYSQDIMKALLAIDLTKQLYIKPYDFIASDKRRAQGIVFKQDGEKVNIRNYDAPEKSPEWFKTASKKDKKRYFEDLSDWFVAEVEAKVVPALNKAKGSGLGSTTSEVETKKEVEASKQEEVKQETRQETKAPSMISMKKAIKAYIEENYEGETMPKLDKAGVTAWYELVLAEEELPFDLDDSGADDLASELDALLGDS